MTSISANLQAVRRRVAAAARASGRTPEDVALIAVSKTQPAQSVAEAAHAGQRLFGENYVREGVAKAAELHALQLEWHFIGPLQSNKTRPVATHFHWVHSVDRLKLAERLSEQRGDELPALNVCIQVNVGGEASKSGVAPDEVPALAAAVTKLPRLALRGLMCIPEAGGDEALLRARFATLRQLRDGLNDTGFALDTLSMGMSDDLELAIAEGATMVRVGTAIFGARNVREERA
ncbi:YggS family pyridoxal phosphate-dependent enzyme [Aromatoleum buckelii]|uniref:Pyridoxal phosphate homeostasis protein n=1 Tax=Aromatoleum buckelii TaxID=200254 RepID=A0ABX1N3M1_9RHOO|nr:YggS family pyridoxal phosphate-dependent enzyme [Aromatoleum buckelii]MCK0511806.1 YggS family pyridoxal phosphate-dependent enzyme [Aromatoleum buckelii]